MRNILFFGDSLTAGYGLSDPESMSFPGRIQQKINDKRLSFNVINAGLSGDTSGGGLARIDYWLQRPVDVFLLELGINDIMRGISPQTTSQNLLKIINRVKSGFPDARLLMIGMELPPFIPGNHAAEFRGIFRKISEANGMALVPFLLEGVAGQQHLNLRDGLHPNSDGYKIIAGNVWSVLEPILLERTNNG